MTNADRCSCWHLRDESNAVAPLVWTCNHDEIRVVTRDGRTLQGWSTGAEWCQGDDGWVALLEVEARDPHPEDVLLRLEEVSTVTPVGAFTSARSAISAVIEAIGVPTEGERNIRLLVDSHHTVEIEVRHEVHRCTPGPQPITRESARPRRVLDTPR